MAKRKGVTCGQRTLVAKTCTTCGEFKDAHCFRLLKRNGRWYKHSQCMPCQHISAKKAFKKANNKFWDESDTQVRVHVPWSVQEIHKLRHLLYEGKMLKEIAAVLGRSVGSVNGASRRYMVEGWRDNVQHLQREAS